MSPGISLSVHFWRGIGGDVQADLFVWRYRLGFLTIAIERNDTLQAYRKLRKTIADSINRSEERR